MTWRTFDDALTAVEAGHGQALWWATSADDDIVGLDFDDCGDEETGQLLPYAQGYIRLLNSYTEWSPSGKGIRIFVRGKLPPEGRKKGKIEVYEQDRFLSITGHHLAGTPLTVRLPKPLTES